MHTHIYILYIYTYIHIYLSSSIFLLSVGKDRTCRLYPTSHTLFTLHSPYSIFRGCQSGLTSHLHFCFFSLSGYICRKITEKLGCQVWSIFLFSKMKITFKKPSHKCLFNNSWLLPWDWISVFPNMQFLEASTKWLSKTARNLCPMVWNVKAGMWLGGGHVSSFVRVTLAGPLGHAHLY